MAKNKILIVDDNPNIRKSLQVILQKEGFITRAVSSGEEVIEEVKKHSPDLILLDLALPGLSGIEVLKYIRTFEQEVIIVIITANPSFESAAEAIRCGAYDYIVKPYDIDEALFTVKRAIEKKLSLTRSRNQALSLANISLELERANLGLRKEIVERKRAEEKIQQYATELEKKNKKLFDALANVKQLTGMLPICASCKKIRNDKGYWGEVESYISEHSDAVFTSGLCPECEKKAYKNLEELKNEKIRKS